MQLKNLTLAALVGAASAQQMMNLTATLASNNATSNLTTFFGLFPELTRTLDNAQNITLLAPSNEAIGALLEAQPELQQETDLLRAVLQYHVLNGTYLSSAITNTSTFVPTLLTNQSYTNVTGGQVVQAVNVGGNVTFYSGLLQNVSVVQPDVNFTGGVIHVIDGLLTVPVNVSETALAAGLTSLVGALNNTQLVGAVNGLSNVTIFAPNNAAFQNIGSAVANLSTEELATILRYHVVVGQSPLYSSTLENGTTVTTLGGEDLTITLINGSVFVNSAEVATPDVLVAGGVVHVIDNVLNPQMSMAPNASATTGAPAFSGATSASEAPFTSGVATPTTTINPSEAGAGAASSTSSALGVAMKTGAVGAAALFGAGAALLNY
ncbi:hypothetical protein H2201_006590 [Coniosporium apollinis]|uniref:FAS1 domain-containing protein n=2 Tax=Coniosporium TaxID=2810619 RepID=A0ABQ9NN39_9PEZI|nr:hypothetical protein H2199_000147 [Cladosporium sp. JES 115]KAJ9661231.1 hypothetical protein H2201_006590 [Coniosporium apollinis]